MINCVWFEAYYGVQCTICGREPERESENESVSTCNWVLVLQSAYIVIYVRQSKIFLCENLWYKNLDNNRGDSFVGWSVGMMCTYGAVSSHTRKWFRTINSSKMQFIWMNFELFVSFFFAFVHFIPDASQFDGISFFYNHFQCEYECECNCKCKA